MVVGWRVVVSLVVSAAGLRRKGRLVQHRAAGVGEDAKVLIATTASLPWFTGTSINPLMRAAHLATSGRDVVLYLPWVSEEQQGGVYPAGIRFESKGEQARYVLKWMADEAGLSKAADLVKVAFYQAQFHPPHHSLYPMGETVEVVDRGVDRYDIRGEADSELWSPDVVVLEEPEHLNWYSYRDGEKSAWRRFPKVVGVVHTNYHKYATTERVAPGLLGELVHPVCGPLKGAATLFIARWMCAAHTHSLIKLSSTLPRLGCGKREVVCNVHGVRDTYLKIGDSKSMTSPFYDDELVVTGLHHQHEHVTHGAYFIGKILWQKGLDRLGVLLEKTRRAYGGRLPEKFSIIGDGPDRPKVEHWYKQKLGLSQDVDFVGRLDHARAARDFRVLINPSVTEVLCTTVAEALAMGKWVVLPDHPSNRFFAQFPTCLTYRSHAEFLKAYSHAIHHEPPPLSRYLRHVLTWQAATERFCLAALPSYPISPVDKLACAAHVHLGRGLVGDLLRTLCGAGFRLGFQSRYVRARRRRALKAAAAETSSEKNDDGPLHADADTDPVQEEPESPVVADDVAVDIQEQQQDDAAPQQPVPAA